LEILHDQGIIHRDIKPGNIMVKPDGSPILLDFGAATQVQSKTVTITQMLSAGYSPFEQYTSRAKQGPYTDVYALGATMFKCITGDKPDDASDRVYGDSYQPLAQNPAYLGAYDSAILSAVDAALMMDAAQRPQNITQWQAVMSGGDAGANAPSRGSEVSPVASEAQTARDDTSQGGAVASQAPLVTKPKGGKTALVTALTAILLLGAFALIMKFVLQDESGVQKQEEVSEAQLAKDQELAETKKKLEEMERQAEARRLAEEKKQEEAARLKREAEARRLAETGSRQAGDELKVTIAGEEVMFRWCPPTGEAGFMMGSPTNEAERDPDEQQHRVVLSKGFWMEETEVTQGLWRAVMRTTLAQQKAKGDSYGDVTGTGNDHPMYFVSWEDCQEFISKLNQSGKLPEGLRAALPTEAQWEYACRAGTQSVFHYGNGLGSHQANFDGNYPYGGAARGSYKSSTVLVKSYRENAWGLYDMHGNVWEWCADGYEKDYGSNKQTDPTGAKDRQDRVLRGGGWNDNAWICRSAFRLRDGPGIRYNSFFGFRLSLRPSP
jgi:sulfatase modifying factor 1